MRFASTELADVIVVEPDIHRDGLRRFGRTDLNVSEFGLGCARIGGIFQRDRGGFLNLLSAALDAGINSLTLPNVRPRRERGAPRTRLRQRRRVS